MTVYTNKWDSPERRYGYGEKKKKRLITKSMVIRFILNILIFIFALTTIWFGYHYITGIREYGNYDTSILGLGVSCLSITLNTVIIRFLIVSEKGKGKYHE